MDEKNLSPIVLFVYDRPIHALRTLKGLRDNHLSDKSILYIYADGAKKNASTDELIRIKETRENIRKENWCKDVFIIESEENKGLADSIIIGVTETVNKYGKVIVLEDDLNTSPYFLQYMNDALSLYEDEEKVMHISGYMFPVKTKLPETFFYNTASCWGWGTWKRAWKHFEPNAHLLMNKIEKLGLLKKFNIEGTYCFSCQLKRNISGEAKTWAIKWYASIFLKEGLSLHPYPSLVNNIGHDGSGEHCIKSERFNWSKLADKIKVEKIELKESLVARKNMRHFYRKQRPFFIFRIKNKIFRYWHAKEKDVFNPISKSKMNMIKTKILVMSLLKKFKKNLMILVGLSRGIHYVPRNYIYKGKFGEEDVIIDVGCGFEAEFSRHMIKKYALKSIGIDPTRKHAEKLKKLNEETNGRFEHHNIAVSVNNGEISFNESEENESGSILTEHKNIKKDKVISYIVKSVRLSGLPNYLSLEKIKYLKLDVEGAEYEIIKNLKPEDLNKYEQIFIEFHHHCTNYSVKDTLESVNKMIALGFKKFTLNNHDFLFYKK